MKERDLAVVATISAITEIPGYDKVELATVENYPVIVGKGEYKVGDKCCYIFYDTVLPANNPAFEFLRSRCWSKSYQGFRIRNMKMCGVFSSGIVFPLSILPEGKYDVGTDVSSIIGVIKYDPESLQEEQELQSKKHSWLMSKLLRFKLFRKFLLRKNSGGRQYPPTVPKSSETNIQKNFHILKQKYSEGLPFYATEKLEGSSSMYAILPKKKEFVQFSHNVYRKPGGNDIWSKMAAKYKIEEALRALHKLTGRFIAIEGEIIGPNIQSNIYKLPELELRIFRMFDVVTGAIIEYSTMKLWCQRIGLDVVPIVDPNVDLSKFSTIESLLAYADSEKSVIGCNPMREGIILTCYKDPTMRAKVKGEKYAAWFSNKDTTI